MKRILIIFLTLNSTLLTLNSYSQWVQQSVPVTSGIFFDMKFVNANTGFIAHSTNVLLKTTDAGYNWVVNKNGRMFSISIVNGQYIYGSGNVNSNGILYKSTNLGVAWDSLLPSPGLGFGYLYFLNQDTGLIGAGDTFDNFIYRTTDGGQTKQLIASFGGSQGGKFHFLKEKVNGEYYGWYYYNNNNYLFLTTNSGLNWVSRPSIPENVKSVFFLNKDTGWASAYFSRNYIYYTTNGGNNWNIQNLPISYPIYDIYFATTLKGWASTAYNKVFATNTGGVIWGTQNLPIPFADHLSFIDSLTGWCGNGNQIAHTTNGGGTITSIISGITETQKDYKLYQNYPNPFNPITNVKFSILNEGNVKIIVYDVMGREVQTLVNETLQPGTYEATFDGSRLGGSSTTATGIYFYQLIVDNKIVQTRKMILLK